MCDIHEVDMEVAARAAASTVKGSGGRGALAKDQGQSGIQTDAEEVGCTHCATGTGRV